MGKQREQSERGAALAQNRSLFARIKSTQEFYLVIILAVIWVIGFIVTPAMFAPQNITTVLRNAAYGGVAALAEGIIILAGEFDMSIGSIVSLAAIVSGTVFSSTGNEILTLFSGILTALLAGVCNGIICVKLKISNLIGTLGTMTIFSGLASLIGRNRVITKTTSSAIYNTLGKMNVGIIPIGFLIFGLIAIVLAVILKKTMFGRKTYAVGANANAAWHAGIDVTKIKFIAFMLGDMLMVLVTFMVGGQVGALNAQLGEGYELDGIVIAVLGGVSLGGGIGSVFGIFMGTMVFQFLLNFLLLTGMGTYLEQVIKGILLVIIVLFSTVLEYRQKNATK